MGWGNIYKRRLKVFTLALVTYLDYKAMDKRVKWFSKSEDASLWLRTHERNAKRIVNFMVEMKGLWVKLGQYISTRPDVLPEAYRSLLTQLQDSLPPRPLKEVRETIERELGKSMNDIFSCFIEAPLATASIAQVHRATLRDGQEVVVKIQHAGIKEVILEDLSNAKSIVDWIAWAEPECDFNRILDEWHKETVKELDFNREAENTRKVSKNLRVKSENESIQYANRVNVLIPEVIQSSERVLILQYMDGIRLNDIYMLDAYGVDKQKLLEEITRAYAHQIYVDGFFNGDPHPGNFLVSKEPPHHPILLDFGFAKSISSSIKLALAKMFLACVEGDHVALLSAFMEMGLKLRLDMPEQAMNIASLFLGTFRPEKKKTMVREFEKNSKVLEEKMDEVPHFNPVDAFPVDAIIFMRVINLLQGLSCFLHVRISYADIMRPFAESTLLGSIRSGPFMNDQWIYNTPIHSDVEAKLRQLLVDLGDEKILGIQVCAYQEGKVIIDTSAGVLGRYDPRPVQPDTLFPVFSVTKGITAGLVHWLVDKGHDSTRLMELGLACDITLPLQKSEEYFRQWSSNGYPQSSCRILKFDATIANIWPEFTGGAKDQIKVHHVLNHSSGLHNAMSDVMRRNPLLLCNWDESLYHIVRSVPQTEPGSQQLYHYLSFGWLCGGVIEHAAGKKFQDVLEEAIIHPLNIEGELYIGIPPGVESRLASLTLDTEDLENLLQIRAGPVIPSIAQLCDMAEIASGLVVLFNTLNVRRAIIPAANGHCSARALARYYAALAAGGSIPPPHSRSSKPLLGSHVHTPSLAPPKPPDRQKCNNKEAVDTDALNKNSKNCNSGICYLNSNCGNKSPAAVCDDMVCIIVDDSTNDGASEDGRMFSNRKIHDAFMGMGDYSHMVVPGGAFGLGFRRFNTATGSFGHSGVGGSTGFCDVEHNFSIAVTVNKLSMGGVTRSIIQLVCSELNIPLPDEFSMYGERGPDMQFNLGQ